MRGILVRVSRLNKKKPKRFHSLLSSDTGRTNESEKKKTIRPGKVFIYYYFFI